MVILRINGKPDTVFGGKDDSWTDAVKLFGEYGVTFEQDDLQKKDSRFDLLNMESWPLELQIAFGILLILVIWNAPPIFPYMPLFGR